MTERQFISWIDREFDNEFNEWLNSDNVIKLENGLYIEQLTQYQKVFTLYELKRYFYKEFIDV